MIYSAPLYRFSVLDFWWEHKVAVIKQYKHSTRKENVSMHLNVSSISGEASDIVGPLINTSAIRFVSPRYSVLKGTHWAYIVCTLAI